MTAMGRAIGTTRCAAIAFAGFLALTALAELNLDEMTPRQALDALYRLKQVSGS